MEAKPGGLFPSKYQRLKRRELKRSQSGQQYNEDFEKIELKDKGYDIIKKETVAPNTLRYSVEKDGEGSAIIRSDNPMPARMSPRMKVVKSNPGQLSAKRRMTRRKFKTGTI
jgi:hypothetical protein